MRKKRNIRFFIALYISKILLFCIKKISKERGTHMPGAFAIKICPNFLSCIDMPKTVIAVTGTNGKTSTSNLINEILINNNIKTINNSKGSNMPAGIASALIEKANLRGKIKEEVAIFEVDERASMLVYKHITPTYLVCTNLFRDSIKRNGHSEFILNKINIAVPKSTILILNSDDLISSSIGKNNKKIFFSLDKLEIDSNQNTNLVCDISVCPICKTKLLFNYRHYHHIGNVTCPSCGFSSYKSDFIVTDVDFDKNTFYIKENSRKIKYNMISDSIFNIYNMVAAIALLRTYGLNHEQIRNGLLSTKIKSSRYDSSKNDKLEVITMLSKNQNPISSSLTIDYVSKNKSNKAVILLLTDTKDKVHGSEDISWLYDTDFEFLNKDNVKQIIACGNRCYDLSLRLKLAGIKEDIIYTSVGYDNIEKLVNFDNIEKVFILYELYGLDIACDLKNKIIGGMK